MKNYSILNSRENEGHNKKVRVDVKKGDSMLINTDNVPDNGVIATIHTGRGGRHAIQIASKSYIPDGDEYPVEELLPGGGVIHRDDAGGNRAPTHIVVSKGNEKEIVPAGMARIYGRQSRSLGTEDPTVSRSDTFIAVGDTTGGDNPQFDGVVEVGHLGINPGWIDVTDRDTLLSPEDMDRRRGVAARRIGATAVTSMKIH